MTKTKFFFAVLAMSAMAMFFGSCDPNENTPSKDNPYANLTQAEIVQLLNKSLKKSFNAPEVKTTFDLVNVSGSSEINRNQKKGLYQWSSKTTGSIEFFEYIENLTSYLYYEGNKTCRTLPDHYWEENENVDLNLGEFVWTVSGRKFTGIHNDYSSPLIIVLNDNEQFLSMIFNPDEADEDDERMNHTFSYANVNPAFPAGFNKADFIGGETPDLSASRRE